MNTYEAKRPQREPTHPGELLRDIIDDSKISITKLVGILQLSRGLLYKIMAKEKPVTPETALKIAAWVGNTETLWLNLQRDWDVWNTKKKLAPVLKEIKKAALKVA